MTPDAFASKWKDNPLSERAGAQAFAPRATACGLATSAELALANNAELWTTQYLRHIAAAGM